MIRAEPLPIGDKTSWPLLAALATASEHASPVTAHRLRIKICARYLVEMKKRIVKNRHGTMRD